MLGSVDDLPLGDGAGFSVGENVDRPVSVHVGQNNPILKRPEFGGDFDVRRVFRSSFVSLQALMHPREVHDAPTLSARVPPKGP